MDEEVSTFLIFILRLDGMALEIRKILKEVVLIYKYQINMLLFIIIILNE